MGTCHVPSSVWIFDWSAGHPEDMLRYMRVLYLYCERFRLATFRKGYEDAPDDDREVDVRDAVVCLVHSEEGDENRQVTKLIKNAKWIAGKFDTKNVVLHFFAHLGPETGEPENARELLEGAQARLVESGYETHLTPFGYFCSMDLGIHGESMAKVYKEF